MRSPSSIPLLAALILILAPRAAAYEITKIEPTVFFPKVAEGEVLQQIVKVTIQNSEQPERFRLRISLEGHSPQLEDLGILGAGDSVTQVRVADITAPAEVRFDLLKGSDPEPVASLTRTWRPQKKWKVFHVAYSHHDLGYADYYHLMTRDVREWGIERALNYCTLTDDWDEDSKYRWTVETSVPLTSYIQNHSKAEVDELTRRIKEGRIELGGIHNSVNTEGMSYELMARLFYTPNRYIVDLLGIEPRKTAILDDVVGLTRSLPLYSKEAEIPYFYHGRNNLENKLRPASDKPLYYWLAPDGDQQNMTIFRTTPYHSRVKQGDLGAVDEDSVVKLINQFAAMEGWNYDGVFSKECWDFSIPMLENSRKIRSWNQKWSYPRLINATMTMFFDYMVSTTDPRDIFVFDKDAPNTWIDQDYTDVEPASQARRLGYAIPTIEKFATIGTVLGGGGYPWEDIWQAYNLLLMYHEHTNGAYAEGDVQHPPGMKDQSDRSAANAIYYETELEMHRSLVREGWEFAERAKQHGLAKLERMIATTVDKTLVVMNPLNWTRTDIVAIRDESLAWPFYVVESASGKEIPCQKTADGSALFVAENVPSLGYKTYRVITGQARSTAPGPGLKATDTTLENQFYKVVFDPARGGIVSIHDKQQNVELVDPEAPYRLNEYLYHHVHGTYPRWHRVESASLNSTAGPVAATMTAAAVAFGARGIRQEVLLYDNIKRIDFVVHLDKASSGRSLDEYKSRGRQVGDHNEAVFYSFPLKLPDFQIKHELSGAVVEPVAGQSIGSSTDYYAIQHFSDVFNRQYGVTLATNEGGLIEYGKPRPSQRWVGESVLEKPAKSHLFLYLMNNWFGTNTRQDQPGPKTFTWSIRTHQGDWREGKAHTFGWDVSHPLVARFVEGKRDGRLPANEYSFVQVDKSNVVLTTLKPAEANGSGIILRCNELAGMETTVTVSLPFIESIREANETSLIEVDRPVPIEVSENNRITFTIRPHGVKTIRVQSGGSPPRVDQLTARVAADMQVDLSWKIDARDAESVGWYNIYRDTTPDFAPSLRHLVGRSAAGSYSDRPALHYGGWLDNRLQPETTYYYKVTSVDRWNHEGPASGAVKATTLSEVNAVPAQVEGLNAVYVSPLSEHELISLWFYTNVESDVTRYRIHRSAIAGFDADDSNLLVELDATKPFTHVTPHQFAEVSRQLREYNTIMYVDEDIDANQTYHYKVCAQDSAGNIGPCSRQATVTLREAGYGTGLE